MSNYIETEDGYYLDVTGLREGTSNLTITDTETGTYTIATITVYDNYVKTYSYPIENIQPFYPNNILERGIATNIYNLNGMYVNNYSCTKNNGTFNVSFDVYNSKYYYGAVDIYDANGNWKRFEEIDKYYSIIGDSEELIIESLPSKTNYFAGELLDTSGMILKLVMGKSQTVLYYS